jgi:predicted ATPase
MPRLVLEVRVDQLCRVFFVRSQGFVEPTAARQISHAEAVEFEKMHEQVYREFGFELVDVPAAPLADRAALIGRCIREG